MFGCQDQQKGAKLACTALANAMQVDRSRSVIRTRRFVRNETAKTTLIRLAAGMLLLVSCALGVWAQEATATRNLILRRDPSKSSPMIGHVAKGDRLTLVQTAPDNGYYHINTEQDVIGWVLANSVSVAPAPVTPPTPPIQPPPSGQCDDSLWSHVYHPQRLIVYQKCISVTGTIVDATHGRKPDGVRHEADGDTHGWLKVDSAYQSLLNAGNNSNEGGNLVFEIVCKYPVTQADAAQACANYQNKVNLPPLGSHVRIVGVYVQDTFHAQWMEIHPVTSIGVE